MEATHKISAGYFPGTDELDLTFEDIETNKKIALTVKIDKKTGNAVANIVPPCTYHAVSIINGISWTKTKDKLPPIPEGLYAGCYLCTTPVHKWIILNWSKRGLWMQGNNILDQQDMVLAWKPLEEPPSEF